MVTPNSQAMRINKEKFLADILTGHFKNNQSQCAKAIGIARPYFNRFVRKNITGGVALITGIAHLVRRLGLNPDDYILNYTEQSDSNKGGQI